MGSEPDGWSFSVAARAFLVAMAAALVADALLGALTSAIAVTTSAPGPPWWVAAHLVDRARWIVFAALALVISGWLEAPAPAGQTPGIASPAVWRTVGLAVAGVPLAWFAAGWLVQAVLFTVAGQWEVEGPAYLVADYYRRLLSAYVPWLLGGTVTVAASRHVG